MARHRRYGGLVFLIVMACAAGIAGVLGYRYLFLKDQIDRNQTALIALCALRQDLDLRIEFSRDFLADHPNGTPGIPRSLIEQSLNNSIRTRKTLEILECKEGP